MGLFIRDGDRGGMGRKSEGRSQTKAAVDLHQNNKMLRQCPLAIAQQLICYAIAVSATVQNMLHSVLSMFIKEKNLFDSKWSSSGLAMLVHSLQCGAETFGS